MDEREKSILCRGGKTLTGSVKRRNRTFEGERKEGEKMGIEEGNGSKNGNSLGGGEHTLGNHI